MMSRARDRDQKRDESLARGSRVKKDPQQRTNCVRRPVEVSVADTTFAP